MEMPWLETVGLYADDLVAQWGGHAAINRLEISEPHVLTWVSPESVWKDTRYYREWVEPQGIIDLMAIGVARDALSIGGIGLGRHRSSGPVGNAEVDAARLLIPHLQRAVAISRLFDVKTAMAATFEATLDSLSAAVILVAEGRRIVHANALARVMLAEGGPLHSVQGALALGSSTATAALAAAVDLATENEAGIGRRGFGLPLRRPDGSPLVLHVLPLKFSPLRKNLAPAALAAVFVAPATALQPLPGEAFAALFDLTVAEGRILEQLVQGHSLPEIARSLGVSQNTVKSHAAHIFSKTGTKRQTELISLVTSLSLPA